MDILGSIDASIGLAYRLRDLINSFAAAPQAHSTLQTFGGQLLETKLHLIQTAVKRSQESGVLKKRDADALHDAAEELETSLGAAIGYIESRKPDNMFPRLFWSIWREKDATEMFEEIRGNLNTIHGIIALAEMAPNIQELQQRDFVFLTEPQRREFFGHSPSGSYPVGYYKVEASWTQGDAQRTTKVNVFVESFQKGMSSTDLKAKVKDIPQLLWWTFEPLKGSREQPAPFPSSLLPCIGFQGHRALFLLPSKIKSIRILRDLLFEDSNASPRRSAPIEARYALAMDVADALLKLHTAGLSHRSIRTDTLLFIKPEKVSEAPITKATVPEPEPFEPENLKRRSSWRSSGIIRTLTSRSSKAQSNSKTLPSSAPKHDLRQKPSNHSIRRIPSGASQVGRRNWPVFGSRSRKPGEEDKPEDPTRSPQERLESERLHADRNGAPEEVAQLPPGFGRAFLFHSDSIVKRASHRPAMDYKWYNDVYRHPEQQGMRTANHLRNMGHDIYSLGVCLLEIGLWETLVYRFRDNDANRERATLSLMLSRKLGFRDSASLRRRSEVAEELLATGAGPERLKKALIEIASEELPVKMGTRYAELVKSCLMVLDKTSEEVTKEWDADFTADDRTKDCAAFRRVVLSFLLSINASFRVNATD
ncbi:hypothetical protein PG999_008472 [Apiospora kogelbergensis]|uniref:Protein kinase domain-containing protein n=1 Tax=Apiospora kogelbergensis TaxID=1337665 RepID=A0AAW0QRW1_9PEZI